MRMFVCAVLCACSLVATAASAQETATPEGTTPEATPSPTPTSTPAPDPHLAKIKMLEEKLAGSASKEDLEKLRHELHDHKSTTPPILVEDDMEDDMMDEVQLEFSGVLRVGYTSIDDDTENSEFIGLNDGFYLGQARLTTDATWRDFLHARIQIEGARARFADANTSEGALEVGLRDAFIEYARVPWLKLRMGQFKPFFDAEEKRAAIDTVFVSRAVEHSGIRNVEGFNARGLSLDRDIGVQILSDPIMSGDGDVTFGGSYALSAVNGQGSNTALNDNDALMLVGRLEGLVEVEDLLEATVGVGYFFNKRTTNVPPDLDNEERQGLAADLSLEVAGLILQAQYIQWSRSFIDVSAESDRTARGYHAALAYRLPYGLAPSYRFATLDPTADFTSQDPTLTQSLEVDEVTHHTVGLNWFVPDYPLTIQVNYTITQEDELRVQNNNRLEVLTQLTF